MRKRKYQLSNADYGTKELARHYTVVPKLVDPSTTAGRVMDGTEIDRLLFTDTISTVEHATLQTLARRLHGFGFVGLKSPDYSSPISADATAVADKKADVIRGAVHLFEKMDKHPHIGPYRRKKLVNLVLQDAEWSKKMLRHQIEELQACIRALDDVFMKRR
jgi:hypothetical protein